MKEELACNCALQSARTLSYNWWGVKGVPSNKPERGRTTDQQHQPISSPTHPSSRGLPTAAEDGLNSNTPNREQKALAAQHLLLNKVNKVGLVIQMRCEI